MKLLSKILLAFVLITSAALAKQPDDSGGVFVGAQYNTTHVYVSAADYDAFVNAWIGTFGGKSSQRITVNVMPVDASTLAQYVWSPVGNLSTFAFQTPVPYPFGFERTGWLVSDMDKALAAARVAGAEVIVDKFKDPIGYDAVIQWPGGVKMQLYWHFTAPSYAPLTTVPETRSYLSPESADIFVRDFLKFSRGKVRSDDRKADAGEIGKSGQTYRRIRIESGFGKLQLLVTDGHLPYPFGYEVTGYEVADLDAIIDKARGLGATVVSPRFDAADRSSAMLKFPGGYIAELHSPRAGK